MTALVVDVSHWQPVNLPWPRLQSAGVVGAIVQLTHGLAPEPHAAEHLAGASAAGLLTGLYHYLTLDDPRRQAAAFAARIPAGFAGRIALDVEQDGLTSAAIRAWLDTYQATGPLYSRPVIIYTRKSWWEANISHAEVDWRYYELWAAGGTVYDQQVSQPPDGLRVPVPWPWTSAVLQQFTAHGRLPGYNAALDLSFCPYLNAGEFRIWWTQNFPPPNVPPGPTGDDLVPITKAEKQALLDRANSQSVMLNSLLDSTQKLLAQVSALVPDVPPAPVTHTMATLTNQQVINLFNVLFVGLAKLESVLTVAQRDFLYANRAVFYTGPAVEQMALTDAEKARIIAALG